MERIAIAVESLLVCPDLDKALESAILSLCPLQKRDFPTKKLAGLFGTIMEKHSSFIEGAAFKREFQFFSNKPGFTHVRYSLLHGRSKHWFKKRIWELLYACMHHNGM